MTGTALVTVDESFNWSWGGVDISSPLTRQGAGPSALLLPALSSISTRSEMAPLQTFLAEHFETVAPDWPGFGSRDKPRVAWTPAAMASWLDHLLRKVVPRPALIVAAGHAAGYVLRRFVAKPEDAPHLVLVAPTWRGPLPTMMGCRPGWLDHVRAAVEMPVTGPALYALNLNDIVIRRMAREHVYSDPDWLTPERMESKREVAHTAGARFASVRFVTGALDPFGSAEDFRAAGVALPKGRLHLIWGEETPRKSLAEMVALAEATGITPTILPRGNLALHEEFAGDVAQAILTCISASVAGAPGAPSEMSHLPHARNHQE